jgi:hypothetical protein
VLQSKRLQTCMFKVLCACNTQSARSPIHENPIHHAILMVWSGKLVLQSTRFCVRDSSGSILLHGRRGWLAKAVVVLCWVCASACAFYIYLIIYLQRGCLCRRAGLQTWANSCWLRVCVRFTLAIKREPLSAAQNGTKNCTGVWSRVRFLMELLLICIVNTRADVPRSVKIKDNLLYTTISERH